MPSVPHRNRTVRPTIVRQLDAKLGRLIRPMDAPPPNRLVARAKALLAGLCLTVLATCTSLINPAAQEGGTAVTQWTLIADEYGAGNANWRTLAIMHRAMHDALNAAQPIYARWSPPTADEPPADGAPPPVAMAAAAHEVLLRLHPDNRGDTDRAFGSVLARYPDGAARQAGIRLGTAIGAAAVRERVRDGSANNRAFAGSDQPGRWRPTPSGYLTSGTNDTHPFLFASAATVPLAAPPDLGSATYMQQRAETLRLGGAQGSERMPDQTMAALFWAYQSSQRGYVYLAVKLLAAHPRPGGLAEQARIMSQLTAAMADSAILVWGEKEKFSFWRPITAIRTAQRETDAANP